jgi:hypothetical protein
VVIFYYSVFATIAVGAIVAFQVLAMDYELRLASYSFSTYMIAIGLSAVNMSGLLL